MTTKFFASVVLVLFASAPIVAQPPVEPDPAKILIEAEVLDLSATGKAADIRSALNGARK